MNKTRGMVLLLALSLAAASLGNSQSNGSTSANAGAVAGSNSQATAPTTNNNNTTVTMPPGETPHQLIQAAPGPIPGMFPGYALDPRGCFIDRPNLTNLKFVSQESIEAMAMGHKLPRGIKPTLIEPREAKATSYNGPIGIMEYDPIGTTAANDGDIVLAGITLPGKPGEINEALRGTAMKALKKIAPAMQRVAVTTCIIYANHTATDSHGLGIVASGTNASGQIGGSAAVGRFHGDSYSDEQREFVTTAYAMNGPYNLLAPPEQKKDNTVEKGQGTPPQPPAPAQTIEVKLDLSPLESLLKQLIPQKVEREQAATCSKMPKAHVFFGFNIWEKFDPKYQSDLQLIADWLRANPDASCNVTIEGYASFEANDVYNDNLAAKRVKLIHDLFVDKYKDLADRVTPYLSGGKRFATLHSPNPENNEADRKVIFSVRSDTSE